MVGAATTAKAFVIRFLDVDGVLLPGSSASESLLLKSESHGVFSCVGPCSSAITCSTTAVTVAFTTQSGATTTATTTVYTTVSVSATTPITANFTTASSGIATSPTTLIMAPSGGGSIVNP